MTTVCGQDDDSLSGELHSARLKSSSGGELKQRGLPLSGGSHGTPGAKVKLSSSSFVQSSTPTDSHPGESESSKYGSQVSTRPSNHASIASLNGLDRDSEVTLLSPASPQEICPLGVQLWTNPLGITDQLILRKDRCKVPLNTDLLFMYRTSVWYRLSTLRLTTSLLDVRYRTNPKGI